MGRIFRILFRKCSALMAGFVFISVFVHAQPAAEFVRQDIVGAWKAFNGEAPACEFVFFADSTMNIEVLFLPYKQDGGYLSTKCKEYITHEEYRIKRDKEGLWLLTTSPKGCPLRKDRLYYYGDSMVRVTYKWFLDTRYPHIDEVMLLKRDSPVKSVNYRLPERKGSVYTIPAGFSGKIYVVYGQQDGVPVTYDEHGRLLLEVPQSGVLYTQAKAQPESMAMGLQLFYYRNEQGVYEQEIPAILNSDIQDQAFYRQNDIADDSIFLVVKGYNQYAREIIEREVGHKVYGNIECLEFRPYEEIKRNNKWPFRQKWQF